MDVIDRSQAAKKFLNLVTSQTRSGSHVLPSSSEVPQNFDTLALFSLEVLSVDLGRVVASFPVSSAVTNRYKTLHGGCIGMQYACLFHASAKIVEHTGSCPPAAYPLHITDSWSHQVIVYSCPLSVHCPPVCPPMCARPIHTQPLLSTQ